MHTDAILFHQETLTALFRTVAWTLRRVHQQAHRPAMFWMLPARTRSRLRAWKRRHPCSPDLQQLQRFSTRSLRLLHRSRLLRRRAAMPLSLSLRRWTHNRIEERNHNSYHQARWTSEFWRSWTLTASTTVIVSLSHRVLPQPCPPRCMPRSMRWVPTATRHSNRVPMPWLTCIRTGLRRRRALSFPILRRRMRRERLALELTWIFLLQEWNRTLVCRLPDVGRTSEQE